MARAGMASGTFYDRRSGKPTFAVPSIKAGPGDNTVAVTVAAGPGVNCTLVFTGPAGAIKAILQ